MSHTIYIFRRSKMFYKRKWIKL